MLENFTLYDETSGQAVTTKDIASRLKEVRERERESVCVCVCVVATTKDIASRLEEV